MTETIGDLTISAVGLIAAVGLAVGLIVEIGFARQISPVWRRFIGMDVHESGPRRPRYWAIPLAIGLLTLTEATVLARLGSATSRSDTVGSLGLAMHIIVFVLWAVQLWVVRRKP